MHYSEMAVMTMRESGQPWLGIIPSEWTLSKIGNLYSLRNEKVSDKDYPPLSVTMGGIVPQLETVAKSDNEDNRKLVRVGDFAINSRSDRRGSCGISEYDGSVSLINTVLMPRGEMNPSYYNWLFHTVSFADEFYKWGHGIVDDLWTTRWQEMKRIVVPVPPLDEQATIAAYLDDQVSQIDSIIEDEKASIEEYKQWKASAIFEAVTKGIKLNVTYKKSHDFRIGEIPAHWRMIKVKQVARLNPSVETTGITPEMEVTFAPMECIRTDKRIERIAPMSDNNSSYSSFNEGDIALAKVTPCFQNRNVCIMSDLKNGFAFGSSELFNIRPFNINARYLLYFFMTEAFKDGGVANMTGVAGLQRISSAYVRNAILPLPPEEEQIQIVSFLDKQCENIDELIAEKSTLVENLEMYKRSLIYESVTGKRKVV